MTVFELYGLFDREIPRALSCEWDNDGLMCSADTSKEVGRVLCTLDITEAAVDYAVCNNFDLIISHHPLVFSPLPSVTSENNIARKVIQLLGSGISAFSFHTRADAHPDGVNARLAKLLGIEGDVPFGPLGEEMGRVGEVSPCSLSQFCERVKSALGAPIVLASGERTVQRVAVLGGSGKDFVKSAIDAGADTFLTGRISYEKTLEAKELGINLIEAGHFYTEHHITEFYSELVKRFLPTAYTEIFSSNQISVL